jgi:hypothetical protein
VSPQARGTFEVEAERHPPYDTAPGATIGRTSLTKVFQGDVVGTSTVEMLSAVSEVHGSAGYVAIERIDGSVHGRAGSFVVQHNGIMTRGAPELSITIVPDSGTGELAHIAGAMKIDIVDGAHHYTLDYTFAEPNL